ncbi:MAG: DUF4112 domain-containing protein [Chitinivibrionales bacterium]|nr:DUF4112 domain-containing protein [Chitinivibrionales bacterium]
MMDDALRVPGTRWRVGLDGLIGLIPGLGDTVGAAVSSIIVVHAAMHGVPLWILGRMVLNVAVEWAVGLIPLMGDLFDFAWKANTKNIRLLLRYLDDPRRTARRSAVYVIFSTVAVILLLVGLFVLFLLGLRWVYRFIAG